MRGPFVIVLALVAALAAAVGGCGSSDSNSSSSSSGGGTAGGAEQLAGCRSVTAPAPKKELKLPKPKLVLSAGKTYTATVTTNCGSFTITLDPKVAPKTGGSFYSLAKQGFYDKTVFHRIAVIGGGVIIQGGDPLGTGTGGSGYTVVEPPPKGFNYTGGLVAMAKGGSEPRGASSSQFFLIDGGDTGLPADYAVLGTITKGLSTVDRLAADPIESAANQQGDGKPSVPIVIEKVTVAGA